MGVFETHATGNGAQIYTPQFSRKHTQNWVFKFGHGSLLNLYVYLINAWLIYNLKDFFMK